MHYLRLYVQSFDVDSCNASIILGITAVTAKYARNNLGKHNTSFKQLSQAVGLEARPMDHIFVHISSYWYKLSCQETGISSAG